MKHSSIFILIVLMNNCLLAQKIVLEKESINISGKKIEGQSSIIEAPYELLSDSWIKSLRAASKMRKKGNYYQVESLEVNETLLDQFIGFTRVYEIDSLSSKVWLGVDRSKTPDSLDEMYLEAVEYYVTEFTYNHYRDKFQREIERTERAINFSSKQYQRYITEENSLSGKLDEAENEKVRLQHALEETELDIAVLKQKLIDNKKNQQDTYLKIEQIKKILDDQKNKLKAFN